VPDLSRNALGFSLSVRNGGIPTDIAPPNRSDIPSHWERGDEFVCAAWHCSGCDFVLVDCGRARRGAVLLEIRQKYVAADYCASVLLSAALVQHAGRHGCGRGGKGECAWRDRERPAGSNFRCDYFRRRCAKRSNESFDRLLDGDPFFIDCLRRTFRPSDRRATRVWRNHVKAVADGCPEPRGLGDVRVPISSRITRFWQTNYSRLDLSGDNRGLFGNNNRSLETDRDCASR
jgi:hypothetical protein